MGGPEFSQTYLDQLQVGCSVCVCWGGGGGGNGWVCVPPRQEDWGPRVQPDPPGPAAGRMYVCVCVSECMCVGGGGGGGCVFHRARKMGGPEFSQTHLDQLQAGCMCVYVCV